MEVCCWREYRSYPASLCCYKMRPCLYRRLPPVLFHEVVGKHSQTIVSDCHVCTWNSHGFFSALLLPLIKSFVFSTPPL